MTDYDTETQDSNGYRDAETLCRLYWDEGLSSYEIADRFGVTKTTILRWMNRLDIDRRDKLESIKTTHPHIRTDAAGYVRIQANGEVARMHQLIAIAEGEDPYDLFGGGIDIHHKNGIPWHNSPDNLRPMDRGEHTRIHQR